MEKEGKSRLRSKTYGFAGILMVAGLAIATSPDLQSVIAANIPPEYQGLAVLIVGAIVAALREATSEPLAK